MNSGDPPNQRRSGCWSDIVVGFSRTCGTRTTARTLRLGLTIGRSLPSVAADGRRQRVERNGLAAVHLLRPILVTLRPGVAAIVVLGGARLTISGIEALAAFRPLGTLLRPLVLA